MKLKERSKLALRALVVFWALCALALALLGRLFVVQVREGAGLAAVASENQQSTFDVVAKRGDIIDRFGNVFATSLASWAVFAQPHDVTNASREALRLSGVLRVPAQNLERILRRRTTFVYLARDVLKDVSRRIDAMNLPGIGTTQEPMGLRVAPQARTAATVVGFTGVDDQGLAGIELAFNSDLTGAPGKVSEDTDNAGRPIPFGHRKVVPAQPGATVVLTLDRTLQFAADEILRKTVARYHASSGSAVIMRAQTGEILALADWPGFDPNNYSAVPAGDWRNRAITDPYEPGSTFKLITAAAALDSGKVSLDDTFPALDSLEVGQRIIHNADDGLMASGHAWETLDDIVAFSHNVGAAQVALRTGKATMYRYIQAFGFDDMTGVDLPGESSGIVGTPDNWWGSRLATIGFGQGVSVTALALARAYCAIANGGLLMRPLIVREVDAASGAVLKRFQPYAVRRVIKPQTAASLLNIMRDVVRRGTAKGIIIPGYAIAGKTGTAQMVIDGAYVPGAYTSSFVGIVPADKPEYVILVKVDRPQGEYYASIVAAPAFRELAQRVLWREDVAPKHEDEALTPPVPLEDDSPVWQRSAAARRSITAQRTTTAGERTSETRRRP